MTKGILAGIIAMATIVVASNILVQFLYGDWLTLGAFTYPLAFLVTDLMNRLYGTSAARKVVFVGFGVGVLCSLIGSQIQGEFGALVSARIAVASGTAFLIAQMLDIGIFSALRNRVWWSAPLTSSIIGGAVDTAIFFGLAFSAAITFLGPVEAVAWANEPVPLLGMGPVAPLWVSLAVADFGVKLTIALIALVPFRALVVQLRPSESL